MKIRHTERTAYALLVGATALLTVYTATQAAPLMDLALVCGLLGVRLWWAGQAAPRGTRTAWTLGAALIVVGLRYPSVRVYLGYPLAGTAALVWLGSRFSTMPSAWTDAALVNLTSFAALIGGLTLLAPAGSAFGWAALVGVPLLALLTLNHLYKFLAERRPSRTLAAQYVGLAAFLTLLAYGFGALRLHPAVPLSATWDALAADLARWIVAAVVLGATNEITAALRGGSGKVTGLLPFWMLAGGLFGWALAQYSVGLVELSGGTLPGGFTRLIPLSERMLTAGMVVFMLGLWRRRARLGQSSA